MGRAAVSALFEKAELELEEIQEVAIVGWHGRLHHHESEGRMDENAVTEDTSGCDLGHEIWQARGSPSARR